MKRPTQQYPTTRMTVYVATDYTGRILETAPITRKFINQPIGNLERWMRSMGGFRSERIAPVV